MNIVKYLYNLIGDVFKVLPMKEDEINGKDVYVNDYIDTILVNMKGATTIYPELSCEKDYLYVINNLQYLTEHDIEFRRWRKIILNSTTNIHKLYVSYRGGNYDTL